MVKKQNSVCVTLCVSVRVGYEALYSPPSWKYSFPQENAPLSSSSPSVNQNTCPGTVASGSGLGHCAGRELSFSSMRDRLQ